MQPPSLQLNNNALQDRGLTSARLALPGNAPTGSRPISLRWRILAAMLIMAMVPLVIMAYQGFHCARMAIMDSVRDHMHLLVDARVRELDAWVDERKAAVSMMADAIMAAGPDTTLGRQLLLKYRAKNPACRSVAIYNDKGDCVYNVGRPPFAHLQLNPAGTSTKSAAGNVAIATLTHEQGGWGLRITSTMPGNNKGAGRMFLVVDIDIRKQLAVFMANREGLYQNGRIHLVQRDTGAVLWSRDEEHAHDAQHATAVNAGMGDHGSSGLRRFKGHGGHDLLVATGSLLQLPMRMMVELDREETLAWVHSLKIRALLTGIVVFACALALSFWCAAGLALPFHKLAAFATHIAGSGHGQRIGPMRSREATEVANALNRMLDALEHEQKRLAHARALAAIGELTSSIVHEMRNPLSSVTLNFAALAERVKDDDDFAELARIGSEQADRLEKMLGDLLGYGKPLNFNAQPVKLESLVIRMVEVMRPQAQRHNLELIAELDRAAGVVVMADPEHLQRAVENLVQNAIQVSSPGSMVTVVVKALANDCEYARITVMDQGPGIPEVVRSRLFEPFFTTRENGTGLGLANVRKIMEYHGGRVDFETRPGNGTAFHLDVPLGTDAK